jgi:hypothetical protein
MENSVSSKHNHFMVFWLVALLDKSNKILSFIVSPSQKEASATFNSLKRQTLHNEIYSVIGLRDSSKYAGEIVSKTINGYLKYIELEKYDFLLKSDNDVLYSRRFLEVNCEADYDLLGVGAGLLIKVKPFLKVCKGMFAENDIYDTELYMKFQQSKLKVLPYKYLCNPSVFRKMNYGLFRMFNTGKLVQKLGVSFKHYAYNCLINGFRESPYLWLCILGYVLK